MKRFVVFLIAAAAALADGPGKIISKHAAADFELSADPNAKQWKGVAGVIAENDSMGKPLPGYRTEIRSRWTEKNLYLLYIQPYKELYLIDNPSTTTETNKLWEHDVAEVFVGADFDHIRQYKELQVSPQGEWVDLEIDRDHPKPEGGWHWNSGYTVKARIDDKAKIWYGEMKIPLASLTANTPKPGDEMRINFYRMQGPPKPERIGVAWQPTNDRSYHVPEAFGRLVFGK
ncbi:MAG: carbohydrate-binding family 9-like protein [Bryobacteraceae bacterium]